MWRERKEEKEAIIMHPCHRDEEKCDDEDELLMDEPFLAYGIT